MSVRPVPVGEERKAFGHPFVNIYSTFGATQGLLVFLHRTRQPFRSNWFAAPNTAPIFLTVVVGGYLLGGLFAMGVYSDWNVIRLVHQHKQDATLNIEGQNIKNLTY